MGKIDGINDFFVVVINSINVMIDVFIFTLFLFVIFTDILSIIPATVILSPSLSNEFSSSSFAVRIFKISFQRLMVALSFISHHAVYFDI